MAQCKFRNEAINPHSKVFIVFASFCSSALPCYWSQGPGKWFCFSGGPKENPFSQYSCIQATHLQFKEFITSCGGRFCGRALLTLLAKPHWNKSGFPLIAHMWRTVKQCHVFLWKINIICKRKICNKYKSGYFMLIWLYFAALIMKKYLLYYCGFPWKFLSV